MNTGDSTEPFSISKEAIQSELEKICSSATLGNSTRLCRFLRYVVELTLAGRGNDLKEYLLGVDVFDRPASYDPNIDSIVRSGAKRLRSKLKQYFESEGIRDRILINLRAGSYIPLFRQRDSLSADLTAKPALPLRNESSLLIAVLPFASLGEDPETEVFADGLTEEIAHRISQIGGLEMVARRSASQFKSMNADLATIHNTLGADLVLEGSVRKDNSHLRISVELANTSDGHQIWSEQIDREMTEVFKIQDEIASAIVTTLRPRSSQFRDFTLKSQAVNLEAYSLYLRGRQLWNKQTRVGLSEAIGCFEEAIRKCPTYAPAYAGLADCYLTFSYLGTEAPKDCIPPAKAAALQALELDDELAEAITSLASISLLYEWDWKNSEDLFLRAIRFNADASAHYLYGLLLEATDRFKESLEHLRLAVRFDPLAAQPQIAMGLAYYRQRKYELAIQHLNRALELPGNPGEVYFCLSLIYMQQELLSQAMECAQKAHGLAGTNSSLLASIGEVYALAGKEAEAQQVLEELSNLAHTTYVSPVNRALLYLALGEKNAALDSLQQGYDERASWMIWLKVDPRFDAIRTHPRFVRLIKEMGFPSASGAATSLPE